MKNTKYKLFLLVSKYMPVVITIGIFINIIDAKEGKVWDYFND